MKVKSLVSRVNALIAAILFVVFVSIISFVVYRTYQTQMKTEETVAYLTGEKYAAAIHEMYQQCYLSAKNVESEILTQMGSDFKDRKTVISAVKNILTANPNAIGMRVCFEPNAFDQIDFHFAETSGHDATGRFIPYIYKAADGTAVVEPLIDYDKEESKWYSVTKRENKMTLTDPYTYKIDGVNHVITTISIPIHDDGGAFIGVASVDINQESFQKILDSIGNGKESSIVTDKGLIVAVTGRPDLVNQSIVSLYPQLESHVQSISSGSRFRSEFENSDDGKQMHVFAPLNFQEAQTNWAFVIKVSMDDMLEGFRSLLLIMIIVSFAGLASTVFIISIYLRRTVNKPIRKLLNTVQEVAMGNVDYVEIFKSDNELGKLSENISIVAGILNNLINETKALTDQAISGRFNARAQTEGFSGGYKAILEGFNGTLDAFEEKMFWYEGILDSMSHEVAVMDIDMNLTFMNKTKEDKLHFKREEECGKQCDLFNSTLCNTEQCPIIQLRDYNNPHMLFERDGFAVDIDTSYLKNRKGEYIGYVEQVRDVTKDRRKLEFQQAEVDRLAKNLERLAQGNLDLELKVREADQYTEAEHVLFTKINASLIEARESLANYIGEISNVLEHIAHGDLDVMQTGDFKGDFAQIKTSMNMIIESLNETLLQINQSANQVLSGASQVANSAQSLSQGATQQASSIEELSATIEDVSVQIANNAKTALSMEGISNESVKSFEHENRKMGEMVAAMSRISDASQKIAKIIKTIDDIAFQTNILALNAAVEAARAGEAGKGFAVVADEVRNLASKSAEAAKDTEALIENSVIAVEQGSQIADETAKSLNLMVESARKSAVLAMEISQASNHQAMEISQVTQAVRQISGVVQTNSATAEESAAASEELSGQADMMMTLVNRFKLSEEKTEARLASEDTRKRELRLPPESRHASSMRDHGATQKSKY